MTIMLPVLIAICVSSFYLIFALNFLVGFALDVMNQKLCRLKCNDVQYYLLTSDKDGGFELLLTDTVSAWHGRGTVFLPWVTLQKDN